jgi:hypothetical protein
MRCRPVDSPFYQCGEQMPDLGNNGIHYFLVGQRRPQRQMCILREVMPPGPTPARHAGARGRGGRRDRQGRSKSPSASGSASSGRARPTTSRAAVPHRFRNVGDGDAILVSAKHARHILNFRDIFAMTAPHTRDSWQALADSLRIRTPGLHRRAHVDAASPARRSTASARSTGACWARWRSCGRGYRARGRWRGAVFEVRAAGRMHGPRIARRCSSSSRN